MTTLLLIAIPVFIALAITFAFYKKDQLDSEKFAKDAQKYVDLAMVEVAKTKRIKASKLHNFTIRALRDNGVETIYDVVSKTPGQINSMSGIGKMRFYEIYLYIHQHWKINSLWVEKKWKDLEGEYIEC
jgi:hypothetical protein